MEYAYAFDGSGTIKGACVSPNTGQEQAWANQGLYVLRGPEIDPKLYKYAQDVYGSWVLTAKSAGELAAEAQAILNVAAALQAKEAAKLADYLALPTKAEIEAAFLDANQRKVIKALKKAIKWLALDEGGD